MKKPLRALLIVAALAMAFFLGRWLTRPEPDLVPKPRTSELQTAKTERERATDAYVASRLGETGPVAGRVIDAVGKPLPEVTVVLTGTAELGRTKTDATGAFRFELGGGPMVVSALRPLGPQVAKSIAGPATDLVLSMPASSRVNVKVQRPNGAPLRDTPVSFANGVDAFEQRADHNGETFRWLEPGRWEVRTPSAPLAPAQVVVIEPGTAEGTVFLIVPEPALLGGFVRLRNGTPVPQAIVKATLAPEAGVRVTFAGGTATATTDAQGKFLFEALPAGVYQLAAEKSGMLANEYSLKVVRTGGTETVLYLSQLVKVRGRVVSSAGEPVRRFSIYGQSFHSTDGTFHYDAPTSDKVVLEVRAEGAAPAVWESAIGPETTEIDTGDIQLGAPRSVTLTVIDRMTQRPVGGAFVDEAMDSTRLEGFGRQSSRIPAPIVTNDEGQAVLVDLSPNPVRLTVTHGSYRAQVVTVPAGTDRLSVGLLRN